jgi:hypothetical protein
LLGQHQQYTSMASAMCQAPNQYVILDNGAYEGSLVDAHELLHLTNKYKVDEVVVPDRIKSTNVTVEMARTFRRMYNNSPTSVRPVKFMFVLQGSTWHDFRRCLDWALEQRWINTIAIPRHTIETCMDPTARLMLAKIVNKESSKNVHLLGASPLWTEEIKEAANLGFIRGMDTSMPYVYGIARKPWPNQDVVDSKLTRDTYFETEPDEDQTHLINVNVERMVDVVYN